MLSYTRGTSGLIREYKKKQIDEEKEKKTTKNIISVD
jgi:hypothetical protein